MTSREKERQSSTEAAGLPLRGEGSPGGAAERIDKVDDSVRVDAIAAARRNRPKIGVSVAVAAISAWVLFVAVYALIFSLSGIPIGRAVRGALANGIPDGLLVLAVF